MFKLIIDCECNDNTVVEEFKTRREAEREKAMMEAANHYQMTIEEVAVIDE